MGHTHGTKWDDEKIKNEINRVCKMLMIDRMPTRSEIRNCLGNDALTNKISKTYGYYGWAEILGLSLKPSETGLGKQYEYIAEKILESKGFNVEQMSQNHAYDLLVDGVVKIDVKVSHPSTINKSRCHTFASAKRFPTCDVYMLFCLDEKEKCERLVILPSSKAHVFTICIGGKSVYNEYIGRWDIIKKYSKLMQEAI